MQAVESVMPGDLLVIFSDGILEATDIQEEEFGEEGIVKAVEKHWNRPPAEICRAVLDDVRVFLGKEEPHDDQTLLIVRLDQARAGDGHPLPSAATSA
jgi:serine phosphatase RsbU (regulator of sigma subunit)